MSSQLLQNFTASSNPDPDEPIDPPEVHDPLARPQVIPREPPAEHGSPHGPEQYPDDKDMPLPND